MKLAPQILIDAFGDTEFRAMRYSGRGMFGKECVGALGRGSPLEIMAALVEALPASLPEIAEDGERAVDDFADLITDLMRDARSDSLGRGTVIYWPQIAWPEGAAEPEDHEEGDEE